MESGWEGGIFLGTRGVVTSAPSSHPLLTSGDDWSDDHARLLRARATADPHGAEDTSQGTTGMCVGSASVASVSRCTATNRYIPPGSLVLSK